MTINQEENKKVVQRLHEALNALDWKKVEELLADNALMGQPGQLRTQGNKQIVARLVKALATVKSLRCEILDLGVVGPYVVDERIDWLTAGDKEVGAHVSGSYLVENGRILDWTEWVSSEGLRTRS